MAAATVHCPRCYTGVKSTAGVAAVRCPGCGTTFRPPAADSRAIYLQPRAAPAPAGLPTAGAPAGINPRRLGLVAAGAFLYLSVGVALAYYCLAAAKRERAATGHSESARPAGTASPVGDTPEAPLIDLPREEQAAVNQAIDRGVRFLKTSQNPQGTWDGTPPVGYAALPGLTLLECGVPAGDPNVQKAAVFVRQNVERLDHTYSLALAVLFLDRLGDPKDDELIIKLAVRLVAGQTATGGWTYQCPVLTPNDHRQLYQVLQATRPGSAQELYTTYQLGQQDGLLMSNPAKPAGSNGGQGAGDLARLPAVAALPANLKGLAVLRPPAGNDVLERGDESDNSNTQFALLGLWVARRRHLPVERSLALVVRRFRASQSRDGSWFYKGTTLIDSTHPTMTCAGLLGLAVGHGLAIEAEKARDSLAGDAGIEQALQVVAKPIGPPRQRPIGKSRLRDPQVPLGNLYYLWSLERVAVLYHLQSIGGKPWYLWGAEKLLVNQNPDNGSWSGGGYPASTPAIDTCFALLFLKQANLAQDLTTKLQILQRPG